MALKITAYLLDQAIENVQAKAKAVKDLAVRIKGKVDTGPIQSDEVINMMWTMRKAWDVFNAAKSAPGLNEYAKTEFNDPNLDYVAEIEAVMAACVTCYLWVNTNFPKDANGYLLKDKIVNGEIENRVFAQASTTGLSTALGTLIASFG